MREDSFHHRHYHHWFLFLPMIVGGLAFFAAMTMLLWNALLPGIFELPKIDFWQALGLLVLSRLLFGGLGHAFMHGHRGGGSRRLMMERWQEMSPEERKNFRKNFWHRGFDRRCGCPHEHGLPETQENEPAATNDHHE